MPKPQVRPEYRLVSKLLRELRDESGLSQRELADRLGVAQMTVYRMEAGIRRCDVLELFDWCRACGANPASVTAGLLKRYR